jgi:hypothetical protein
MITYISFEYSKSHGPLPCIFLSMFYIVVQNMNQSIFNLILHFEMVHMIPLVGNGCFCFALAI